ncbi:dihydroxy-acid dehydratase domain-containing protein [Actinomadura madurae]|uniref:dihydroxy-acid dehydratase domain-containing protein n=1 Tax=Actinomadura madurae TaxID=1993 RepID=UPI0020D26200|nr:dihydroxy-acid dehydratase [Actinomadura madurae]
MELPTISLGEDLMKPTAMLYRNLMAMEVEETIRAHPLDGVVLLGNCDKTIPAQLMGAASANLPALQLSGGYRRTGRFHGAEVGAGTDLWKYWEERRNGRIGDRDWQGLEAALGCSQGACNVMGTALTMSMMAEVLGMMVPGASTLPFDDPRLEAKAGETGSLIVEMVRRGTTPDQALTPDSFRNALMALAAVGGSTNAVIHLCALAGRRMIPLGLEEFDQAAAAAPVLADVAPIGRHTIAAFDRARAGSRRCWRTFVDTDRGSPGTARKAIGSSVPWTTQSPTPPRWSSCAAIWRPMGPSSRRPRRVEGSCGTQGRPSSSTATRT